MAEFDLASMSAESLLMTLAKRQEEAINAEAEEARAKAKFEAIQGVTLSELKTQGYAAEIGKKLMWTFDEVAKAHEEYLRSLVAYKSAQSAMLRAKEALGLWQTLRADARRA